MKRILAIASLIVLSAWPSAPAKAQAPGIQMIGGTVSISTEVRAALESYLADYPPSNATYYAPTYMKDEGTSTLVSLAGLNLQSPEDPWHLESHDGEPSAVVWVGTIRIWDNGSGEIFSHTPTYARAPGFAAPLLAPGGGTNIQLPFTPGMAMQYGPRLVHGLGDYGTSGMYAVDLVGGDSLGSNVAPPTIFASQGGTVDYVCNDDTSVAVRTYQASTDDYFVYAHLLDNANLELDHEFTQGATIGSLKYGAFDDTCGWAEQGATIYHVHWMFEPADGAYTVGNCHILLSDKKFHCGSLTIGAGGWITNEISSGGVGGSTNVPSIWDNIVATIIIVITGTANLLPPHTSASAMLKGGLNAVVLFFRLAWVLVRGNLNLVPIAAVLLAIIVIRIPLAVAWLIFWGIRAWGTIKKAILF